MKKKKGAKIVLYHFTAERCIRSIRENGLTLGRTPVAEGGRLKMLEKTQWLTRDPDPTKQSWHTHTLVPYSRVAYRLTIAIPASHRSKLVTAREFITWFPPENAPLVTAWDGSDNWYVFTGIIPPSWIVGAHKLDG